MGNFNHSRISTPTYLATIYLVSMITTIVFIEGMGVSNLKVTLMAMAVPLLLKYWSASNALLYGSLYMGCVLFAAFSQSYVRFSTIGYLGLYIITFILFYNLIVHYKAFSLEYFHHLVRKLIIIFGVTLILQQICTLVGLHFVPFINLNGNPIHKLPIWTMESSHTARILGALMLAYLKTSELLRGASITIRDMLKRDHIKVTILFLWMILTMGSGTGFIVMAIIVFYFIKKETAVITIPLIIALYFVIPHLHIEQLDRAVAVTNATLSGSSDAVVEIDNSAAVRISPILNTIYNTDLSDPKMWFGQGTLNAEDAADMIYHMEDSRIGNINQYGIISSIFSLFFVYGCCIRRFFSLETLFFGVVLGFSVSNIYYLWGCLMIFTCIRYFESNYQNYRT